jgi:hypothetical protein
MVFCFPDKVAEAVLAQFELDINGLFDLIEITQDRNKRASSCS